MKYLNIEVMNDGRAGNFVIGVVNPDIEVSMPEVSSVTKITEIPEEQMYLGDYVWGIDLLIKKV